MATAFDVAHHLLWLASQGEEPDPLTPLRLQKLLYYVQGWHAGAYGRGLFRERIEAWKNGPVVSAVYTRLHDKGRQCVEADDLGPSNGLEPGERLFVESVWHEYRKHSASGLLEMTHREPPWKDARRGLKPDERSSEEITVEALARFFRPEVEKALNSTPEPASAIDLARVYQGVDELERGESIPFEQAFGRQQKGR